MTVGLNIRNLTGLSGRLGKDIKLRLCKGQINSRFKERRNASGTFVNGDLVYLKFLLLELLFKTKMNETNAFYYNFEHKYIYP